MVSNNNSSQYLFFILLISLSSFQSTIHAGKIDEENLLDQKEEGFRYRDNLGFNLNGQSINFNDIHQNLKEFERSSTESFLDNINRRLELLYDYKNSFEKSKKKFEIDKIASHDANEKNICEERIQYYKDKIRSYEDEISNFESVKDKNLAVFGFTILFKNAQDTSIVQQKFLPVQNNSHVDEQNEPFLDKVFISGSYLPYSSLYNEDVNEIKINQKSFPLISLEEATNRHTYRAKKEYLLEDLRIGYEVPYPNPNSRNTKKKRFIHFNGIYTNSLSNENWYKQAKNVISKLDNIDLQNEKIDQQWEGTWGASLVDSEQSLRIYFQENIHEMLLKITKKLNVLTPSSSIIGLVLHIHSRMDMCEVCTLSLSGFMNQCNYHWSQKERKINGKKSFLLEKIVSGFNPLQLDDDFRFRITVSSREPYQKKASVSRRNWSGIDEKSLSSANDENLDFINTDKCIHKPYSDDDNSQRIKRYPKLLI